MPKTKKRQTISQEISTSSNEIAEVQSNHPFENDIDFVPSGIIIPCDCGADAFLPYWEKKGGEIIYGIDKYIVKSISGCGDVWICTVGDENDKRSGILEPNVDIFFSEKDAERKITALKKTEDSKKLSKWRRKGVEDVGEQINSNTRKSM